ncbi:uncharacterized protein adgrf3a [Alosa alosa]|uniref:uncharacterized protein adgrf3a n=1 Tax=Alosa alosa TaxID=278164 RepID=UPI0020150C87|nr:uncharacterized protein adgrf3a [Alosa alosa]
MELFLSMSLNFFLLFNAYITSAENYYQTLNAVISIEDKANDNLTDLLRNFIASSGEEVISQISRTKDCHLKDGEINCVCEALFSKKDGVECNPVNRVSVNGTIVHGKKTYSDDLTNPNTDAFKELSNNIIQEFSKEYSKLKWFNSLTITKFSKGSVKIHFRMTFDSDEGIEGIDNITAELQKEYGKAELVTEGFVRITAPTGRVEYNTNVNLSCETNGNLTGDAAWYLRRENGEETEIKGGTEVELKNQLSKSTIHLSNTSSVWRGSYICEFKQGTVKHQASVFLDVALLPKINIFTDPQFPDCKKPRPIDKVTVTCAIENTTEIYNVNWEDKDFTSPNKKFEHGNLLYSIVKTVVCTSKEDIKVSCNFTNNLNQFKPEYLTIPVIYSDTKVCPKDGDWPEAKAGYVAKLPCGSKQKGERTRECQEKKSSESSNRYKGAAFTVLMAKNPVSIPYIEHLTLVGLFVSVVSLFVCLMIEFAVWNAVVKSSIAHFRHTAVVNISLCLLLADSSFLATAFPVSSPSQWCRWLVVMKHYCFLAMFFWMLCLSLVLLHSLIFIFHRLRKKVYLGASFTVGYVCPLIIVVLTVIAYDNGKEDSYYLPTTCWLKYEGAFQGSFFAFVMPVGIIVAINVLSMLLVIAKLLTPSISEGSTPDDKEVIRGILKAVIFLTPIFGVTWAFGFAVLAIDHTVMPTSKIVNYAFTVCNAFQGLFILLTACLGEKKVRDQLSEIMRCNSKVYKTSRGELSTSKTSDQSSIKKK